MTRKPETVNELLDWTEAEISELPEATINNMSYGITYFEFYPGVTDYTPERQERLEQLRRRLKVVEATKAKPKPRPVKMVECDCGCTVPASVVMSTSTGTSCPECYDRMSE